VAVVSNPKSSECEVRLLLGGGAAVRADGVQIARTNLVSGLLKTLSNNRSLPLPVQLFEVSDVVLLVRVGLFHVNGVTLTHGQDSTTDTGARNERRLSASFSGTASGLEVCLVSVAPCLACPL
jgi:hypothetical protein